MTDNFDKYRQLIELNGGLPDENEHGNLDKYFVVELLRRGKDNPDMSAANYHFRNYYIYSWHDLDKYEQEIKDVCTLLRMRAYCSVNYKKMSQVALDTLAESARRIANHDYKKFYNIFESCSGKFVEHGSNLWIVDIDDGQDTEQIEDMINMMQSGHAKNVIFKMPTRSGCHLITHPFNLNQFYKSYGAYFDAPAPDIKKNHITLLYENL